MGKHRSHTKEGIEEYKHCHHGFSDHQPINTTNYYSYYPKLCARHRVPSVCNSESMSQYQLTRHDRGSHSRNSSSASQMFSKDKTSTIDRHELKNTSSRFYRRKRRNIANAANNYTTSTRSSFNKRANYGDVEHENSFDNECSAISLAQHNNFNNYIPESTPQISNKVFFHLGDVDETTDAEDDLIGAASSSLDTEQQLINFIKTANLTDNEKLSNAPKVNLSALSSASSVTLAAVASSSLLSTMNDGGQFIYNARQTSSTSSSESQSPANMTMDETNSSCVDSSFKTDMTSDLEDTISKPIVQGEDKTQLSWDSYWDGLESVVLGHTNNASIK